MLVVGQDLALYQKLSSVLLSGPYDVFRYVGIRVYNYSNYHASMWPRQLAKLPYCMHASESERERESVVVSDHALLV